MSQRTDRIELALTEVNNTMTEAENSDTPEQLVGLLLMAHQQLVRAKDEITRLRNDLTKTGAQALAVQAERDIIAVLLRAIGDQ